MNQAEARLALKRARRVIVFVNLETDGKRMSGFPVSKAAALRLINGSAVKGTLNIEWASDEQTVLFIGDKKA